MVFAALKVLLFGVARQEPRTQRSAVERTDQTVIEHNLQPISLSQVTSQETIDIEAQDFQSKKRFVVNPRMISDAIIGLSDGLTVPFALTAGLSSLASTRYVVLGGLAELVAGAISMGLGGFIGAKSEADSYRATVVATKNLIASSSRQTVSLVHTAFQPYGLPPTSINTISQSLHESPEKLLDFLMRFHHQTPPPATSRPFVSAATIALGYFLGGLVPLIPYFCVKDNEVLVGLWWSIGIMIVALFTFGYVKTGIVSGWRGRENILAGLKGATQMVIVGGVAAGAAVGIVRAINSGGSV